MATADRIGLEFLCEIGASPVEMARLAAQAGARHISVLPRRLDYNPLGHADWNLLADAGLRRDLRSALADTGVSISLGEGLAIMPGQDVAELAPVVELYCDLGVRRVNGVSMDPDLQRTTDQFARLAEMTHAANLELTVEFAPILCVGTLDEALGLIRQVGQPNFKLLVDVMHFVRAGHEPDDLAAIDPALIGYVQICDGPLKGAANYMDEAMNGRMLPGAGEMPVREILRRIPRDVIVSAEVPQLALAQAGAPALERLTAIVQATSDILESL